MPATSRERSRGPALPEPAFPAAVLRRTAARIMQRCDELAAVTDEPGRITRTFHSPAMQRANGLVGGWMQEAGLLVREDAAFNLIGRLPSTRPRARCLLLGSHLDTVRNAGRYDGPLGVLLGLAVAELLREVPLPFHLEVVGFSDEEGVRYQTTYLGSRAMLGLLRARDLAVIEEKGLAAARRPRGELLAYLEAHIEQGPVLEAAGRSIGVVGAIAGQTRIRAAFTGQAGHAGTTPISLRRDALCGAAEIILAAERCGVTATVGQCRVEPGAGNVIPGGADFTLDVRDARDARRRAACRHLHAAAKAVARRRGLTLSWTVVQETPTVRMNPQLTRLLASAAGSGVPILPSGAGHDAAVMAAACPCAMLFLRCRGGVSHHPDENVKPGDVATALGVLLRTVLQLARRHA